MMPASSSQGPGVHIGGQLSRGRAPLPVAPGRRAACDPTDAMTASSPGPIVLWVSSRYENIELAQAALAHVCRQRGIDAEMEHWIGMALREAVANAVKHGNRLDPDKRVLVKLDGTVRRIR